MKSIVRIATILALVLMPSLSAMAQSTPESASDELTPFAFGLDAPATFIDQRGNAIFSISVTGIEQNWQDHDEYDMPQMGMEYVRVHLAITNHAGRDGTVMPYTMLMLDSMGAVLQMGYIYDRPDVWIDEVVVPAGETVEGSMIFEIYPDLEPLALMWQPEYTSYVIIYLGDE